MMTDVLLILLLYYAKEYKKFTYILIASLVKSGYQCLREVIYCIAKAKRQNWITFRTLWRGINHKLEMQITEHYVYEHL